LSQSAGKACLWVNSGGAYLSEVNREQARRAGRNHSAAVPFVVIGSRRQVRLWRSSAMNGIIYLVGLIVVIMAILSFLGLR
jgi:hypothetical protein